MHYLFHIALRIAPQSDQTGGHSRLEIARQTPLGAHLDIGEAVEHANMVAATAIDKQGDIPGLPSVLVVSDQEQSVSSLDMPVHELVYTASCDHNLLANQVPHLVARNGELVKDLARTLLAHQQLTASSAGQRMELFGLLAEARALLLDKDRATNSAIQELVSRIGAVLPSDQRGEGGGDANLLS